MAEYKGIHGTKIQNYTADPDNAITGQVWYNETSQTMKFQYPTTIASWSTGTSINTARYGGATSGIYTAALLAGGQDTAKVALTESWDGTSWTEVNDLNTARAYMGSSSNAPYTASLVFGGQSTVNHADTELWNGSSWTEVNDLNTARRQISGIGISTAALATNGYTTAAVNLNESWNGTSWTETTDLNTTKTYRVGAGTQTALLVYGGDPSPAVTEDWNGTSWTEVNDLNTGRDPYGQGTGTATNNLCIGGFVYPPASSVSTVEEWNAATPVGAWSTGNDMNTARYNIGGIGIGTAALAVGGRGGSVPGDGSTNNELYNGTSWSEEGDINSARHSVMTSGTTSIGLIAGGEDTVRRALVESWNGTAWTEVADLNTARGEGGGSGANNTESLVFAGSTGPAIVGNTESWNGTSWTEVNDLNTSRYQTTSGLGKVYTTALLAGGRTPGPTYVANTESWNGTSWSELNDLNTARGFGAGQTGTSSSSFVAGGSIDPGFLANTELWNGASWSETSDLNTATSHAGGAAASTTSGVIFGGLHPGPSAVAATEEWSSSSNVVKTITTS